MRPNIYYMLCTFGTRVAQGTARYDESSVCVPPLRYSQAWGIGLVLMQCGVSKTTFRIREDKIRIPKASTSKDTSQQQRT